VAASGADENGVTRVIPGPPAHPAASADGVLAAHPVTTALATPSTGPVKGRVLSTWQVSSVPQWHRLNHLLQRELGRQAIHDHQEVAHARA